MGREEGGGWIDIFYFSMFWGDLFLKISDVQFKKGVWKTNCQASSLTTLTDVFPTQQVNDNNLGFEVYLTFFDGVNP